jgi:hypothetical protein
MGIAAKHLGDSRCAEIARTLFTVTSVEEAKRSEEHTSELQSP